MNVPAKRGRLVVSAVAGAAAVALLAWGAWYGYGAVVSEPVERVVFAGEVERLAPADLAALAATVRSAPSAPLESIRASARRVPWVRDAAVRRLYPDAVEITFSAYTAFAHWNDAELVNASGEVFTAPGAGALPRLRGPDGSAPRVAREYLLVVAALAPLDSPVTEFRLSPRGAWHATLASGLGIALGRGDWRPRAERFARAWPKLAPEARAADHADLRYPGGFALRRVAALTLTPTLSRSIPAPEGAPGRGSTTP